MHRYNFPQECHYGRLRGCEYRHATFQKKIVFTSKGNNYPPNDLQAHRASGFSFLSCLSVIPRGRGGSSCWWRSHCCLCCGCCQTSPSAGSMRHSTVQDQLWDFLQTTTETTLMHTLYVLWELSRLSRCHHMTLTWLLVLIRVDNDRYAPFWTWKHTQNGKLCLIFCHILVVIIQTVV